VRVYCPEARRRASARAWLARCGTRTPLRFRKRLLATTRYRNRCCCCVLQPNHASRTAPRCAPTRKEQRAQDLSAAVHLGGDPIPLVRAKGTLKPQRMLCGHRSVPDGLFPRRHRFHRDWAYLCQRHRDLQRPKGNARLPCGAAYRLRPLGRQPHHASGRQLLQQRHAGLHPQRTVGRLPLQVLTDGERSSSGSDPSPLS
jgi:hypothetical protein